MKRVARLVSTSVLVSLALGGPAYGQFRPGGRRPPSAPSATPKDTHPAKPAASSQAPAQKPTQPTAVVEEGDRDEVLIQRYIGVAVRSPSEEVPVQRLLELARRRDGNLSTLSSRLATERAKASDDRTRFGYLLLEARVSAAAGSADKALELARDASSLDAARPESWLLRSDLEQARGDVHAAEDALTRAAPGLTGPDRDGVLRRLRRLALDRGDFTAAEARQKKLAEGRPGGFVDAELGRELLERGAFERAILELTQVVARSAGDARGLVPALMTLAEAELRAGKADDALSHLGRARRSAGADRGLLVELDLLTATAHRARGTLPTFAEELERASSAERLALAGSLREELGDLERAKDDYRRALLLDPKNVEVRLERLELLELSFETAEAEREYERLIAALPGRVDLSIRYMESLLAAGRRERALAEFDRIAARTTSDPDATLVLLDFTPRLDDDERASALLGRAARESGLGPEHLAELGSRAAARGERDRAHAIWSGIPGAGKDRVRAKVIQGETLIDHEDIARGVEALEEAERLDPKNPVTLRSVALGLTRAAALAETRDKRKYERRALELWNRVWKSAEPSDSGQERAAEARRQLVRLERRIGELGPASQRREARFFAEPPDMDAGLLLIEAELLLRHDERAEALLARILGLRPGDRTSLTQLEAVQSKRGRHEAAIETLARLVERDPGKKTLYYKKMVDHARALKRDDDALRFAMLAAGDAKDAMGQAELGHLLRSQGRAEGAEAAYRRALEQDPDLYSVRLALAELLASRKQLGDALGQTLLVLRKARDPELGLRAAGRALDLSIASDRYDELERALRPLVVQPGPSRYRSLYLALVSAALTRGAATDPSTLSQFTHPLLMALSSGTREEQRIALDLLASSSTPGRGAALLDYAAHGPDEDSRLEAVLLTIGLEGEDLTPRYAALISDARGPGRGPVVQAAVRGVGQIPSQATLKPVLLALVSSDVAVQAEAVLALGTALTAPSTKRAAEAALVGLVQSSSEAPLVTELAALMLGRSRSDASEDALRSASAKDSSATSALAQLSLSGSRDWTRKDTEQAAGLLFEPSDLTRRAASRTLGAACGESGAPPTFTVGTLRTKGSLDLERALSDWLGPERGVTRTVVTKCGESLTLALRLSLDTTQPRAARALELLGTEAATPLRAELEEQVLRHADHPSTALGPLGLLALDPARPKALAAVERALASPDPEAFEAALALLVGQPSEAGLSVVVSRSASEPSWIRRRRFVEAIEQLAPAAPDEARRALDALKRDPSALVQQQAREASSRLSSPSAR